MTHSYYKATKRDKRKKYQDASKILLLLSVVQQAWVVLLLRILKRQRIQTNRHVSTFLSQKKSSLHTGLPSPFFFVWFFFTLRELRLWLSLYIQTGKVAVDERIASGESVLRGRGWCGNFTRKREKKGSFLSYFLPVLSWCTLGTSLDSATLHNPSV